jgi:hypothetical protein
MMIYTSLTLTYFPYSDSPWIEVPFHSDNLLQPNNSLLLILYAAWLPVNPQIPISYSLVWHGKESNRRFRTPPGEHTNYNSG